MLSKTQFVGMQDLSIYHSENFYCLDRFPRGVLGVTIHVCLNFLGYIVLFFVAIFLHRDI